MPPIRSNNGCYTCRLRRKKCDETKPACDMCTSRELPCHGYTASPPWQNDPAREKAETTRIKQAVRENLKRKRSSGTRNDVSRSMPTTTAHEEEEIPLSPVSAPDEHASYQVESHDGDIDHGCTSLEHAGSHTPSMEILDYRKAEQLMHYLDCVFPLQFRFFTPDPAAGGRGWLLWLLATTGPLYHAALSLSALHRYGVLDRRAGNKYAELMEHHAHSLQHLQRFVQQMQESDDLNDAGKQIAILSCGVMLISFELFRGGCNDWRLHLNALSTMPVAATASVVVDPPAYTCTPDSPRAPCGRPRDWQQAALSFLVPVLLWFDLLACASTMEAPKMPFRTLLESKDIDIEGIMGCQPWAMLAIGEIAELNQWATAKRQQGHLSVPYLVSKSRHIEDSLNRGLGQLETPNPSGNTSTHHQDMSTHRRSQSGVATLVTRVFATGALVQLHTVVSGAYPGLPEIRDAVVRAVAAIEALQDAQMVRGLIWPICIAACLAEPDKQPFFERVVTRAIGTDSRDFGTCNTILRIMRKCWQNRAVDNKKECHWKTAMDELEICALLV